MVVKIILALFLGVIAASAVPTAPEPSGGLWKPVPFGFGNPWMFQFQQANPWIPPWVPQRVPCTTLGSTCLDCTTRVICTVMGGFHTACTDSALPYCNLGACTATPRAECVPAAVPVAQPSAPVEESVPAVTA